MNSISIKKYFHNCKYYFNSMSAYVRRQKINLINLNKCYKN